MGHTEQLARFISDCTYAGLPHDVVAATKRCFLDWIGVTLGATGDEAVKILLGIVRDHGGKRQASIFGSRVKTSMLQAALVNGTMSHALDYDDAHNIIRTHPSAPLVPALFAAAEHLRLSGKELITAFVAGYETTVRVGYALGKEYYERGWHATSVLGRLGAAAGTARLFRLPPDKTAVALGLAATQAGGVRDVFGTMGKAFHAGKAAADGLFGALLAREGFTTAGDMLDEKSGFSQVFSREYSPESIVKGLGVEYALGEVNFKPYAACLLVHPVIDAVLAIRDSHHPDHGQVEKIDIRVAPLNLRVTGDSDPQTAFQAKFSLPMAAAMALVFGDANDSLFTTSVVHDPSVRAVMGKVRAASDESMAENEAVVSVVMNDGQQYSSHITAPKGNPGNPMTFVELASKARDLSTKVLAPEVAERVIDTVASLEKLENTAKLVRLCCPVDGQRGNGSR
ncbi:MAG: 2-methylcitrate dehydratase [Syntrophorhabdaceae bacterium PtaU1.Bin034]|jgi:2-methylcitrate dehydratase PrpD|nr:MAG: 2-methylcitrate dehydratase [Syntrophorhabdaceae bacterium PtaU1.Bin034]